MSYYLGIDLGTTYTAAAIERGGTVEAATLGNRSASVPSVVYLREDGDLLVGEAAIRRANTDPGRVAREFKRRVGDPTPIILGGSPYPAEMLMARMLSWAVQKVRTQEGEPPRGLALTHPANWGAYKLDLLDQSIRQVGVDVALKLPEPVAAATFYASQRRLDPGAVVAVYDLGGGTFDAAMVRRTESGFETVGSPEGIERLGGIDFDEAIVAHVRAAAGDAVEQLDPEEPAAVAAMARLRQECIDAKEALSSDTDVSIPVLLPNLQTDVRLTRSEFEDMIRPAIRETIVALRRAIRSASVSDDDISAVLLVGGSSRIPLVAQMVGAELGRPIAIDAHPKDAIGFGAAIAVAQQQGSATPESVRTVLPVEPGASGSSGSRPAPPVGPAVAGAAGGAAGAAAGYAAAGGPDGQPSHAGQPGQGPLTPVAHAAGTASPPRPPAPGAPGTPGASAPGAPATSGVGSPSGGYAAAASPTAGTPAAATGGYAAPRPAPPSSPYAAPSASPTQASPTGGATGSGGFPAASGGGGPNRHALIAAGIIVVAAIVIIGIIVSRGGGDDDDNAGSTTTTTASTTSTTRSTTTSSGDGETLPGYTAAIEDQFVTSCAGADATEAQCQCVYDRISTEIPLSDFIEMGSQLQGDITSPEDIPEELRPIILDCMLAGPGGGSGGGATDTTV